MIAIGCDHAGFEMKEYLKQQLTAAGETVTDFGAYSPEPVDYPDKAAEVGQAVVSGEYECGILICGTGIGISIAANKVKGVRAALCADLFSARMAKEHNRANIITLGARTIAREMAWEIVQTYRNARFQAEFRDGIHQKRIDLISALEASLADTDD